MSEIRLPDEVINHRLPTKQGKKSTKIELFSAKQFAHRWSPLKRGMFTPAPPLNTARRQGFWEVMYRVRINGKWHGGGSYTLFTREQVMEMILGGWNK